MSPAPRLTLAGGKDTAPTPATRIRLLQLQAASEAGAHMDEMIAGYEACIALCEVAADGGEAFPVGVREWARQERDRLAQKLASLRAVIVRAR